MKMAFLLATNNWAKIETYHAFLKQNKQFVWRMGGGYTADYFSKIQYPINVYFFHSNIIGYRAKCIETGTGQTWDKRDIPREFQSDNSSYSAWLKFVKLEKTRNIRISEFPKWIDKNTHFKKGNLGLLRVVDFLGNKKFIFIDQATETGYTEDDESFAEGKKALKKHLIRERNPKIKDKAKERMIKRQGKLKCQVCGFIFEDKYGEIGKDYIEVHHMKPVSELEEGEKTKLSEIALVCSNCHRMIHRKRPWLNMDSLKDIVIPGT